jgi:hypothetical protein
MSRSLILAGLLVDSWRDQSPQTNPSEMNPPDGAIPIRRFQGTSDDAPLTPGLTSLIVLGAAKWSHAKESP